MPPGPPKNGVSEILVDAVALCDAAGVPTPSGIICLPGGRNNRVYRLAMPDGTSLALKHYYRDRADQRDRLGAEWRFLRYAMNHAIDSVPRPVARDPNLNMALFSFIDGAKLAPAALSDSHMDAAARFIISLNPRPRERPLLPAASEACFSIAEHVHTVNRRMEILASIDGGAGVIVEARKFVRNILTPVWKDTEARLIASANAVGLETDQKMRKRDIIVSPSDFGFHNVLDTGEGLCFLDFEYAGLDDPAKLVGDFFACPDVPVPPAHFDGFAATLCAQLDLSVEAHRRMHLLRPLYRIKWACILLNEFLSGPSDRRGFSAMGNRTGRLVAQLEKARVMIHDLGE